MIGVKLNFALYLLPLFSILALKNLAAKWENNEKCKSLRLLSKDNFSKIAKGKIENYVYISIDNKL